jgi:hypothetical protein
MCVPLCDGTCLNLGIICAECILIEFIFLHIYIVPLNNLTL